MMIKVLAAAELDEAWWVPGPRSQVALSRKATGKASLLLLNLGLCKVS